MTEKLSPKKRFPWSALIAGFLGILLGGTIVRTLLRGSPTEPRPADIETAKNRTVTPLHGTDERLEIPQGNFVAGNGVVEPSQRETKVAGDVAGRIETIFVEEGQAVKAGEELARLSNANETAALAAAEADLAAAEADYLKALHGQRREDIDAAIADTGSAKARFQLSLGIYTRNRELAKSGAITTDELDRSKRQADADRYLYRLSTAKKRETLRGNRWEDIQSAKARKLATQARRDQAKAQLDRLTIRAPIAGKILQIKFRIGEYYNPLGPDPVLIMGDTKTVRVRMDVDERDIGNIHPDAAGFVMADAFPGKRFPGKVVEIGKRMGRKNIRTDDPAESLDVKIQEVVLELTPRPEELIPGLRVQGYVEESPPTPATKL